MINKKKTFILFGVIVIVAVVLGAVDYTDDKKVAEQWKECWRQAGQAPQSGSLTENGASAVFDKYKNCLMNTPGVNGGGAGLCEEYVQRCISNRSETLLNDPKACDIDVEVNKGLCLRIYVLDEKSYSELLKIIPPTIEGYRTSPVLSGPIVPL